LEPVKAPFLTYESVNSKAGDTLRSVNWDERIPVDVESIVEFALGIEIVPVRGLKDRYAVDGFLTLDLARIAVDEYILERHPTRYRFTLAHEVGHMVLHGSIFSSLLIASTQEWLSFYVGLDDHDYGWFERQAYWFAGSLLVPDGALVVEHVGAHKT